MSPLPLPSGTCEQTTGFLFSHPCGQPVSVACMRCGQLVCEEHVSAVDAELLCVTCAQDDDGEGDNETASTTPEDDPSYYYDGYGYYGPGSSWGGGASRDPNDFTEADGESLRREDDASFEEDPGGS